MIASNPTKEQTHSEHCANRIPVMEFTGFGKAYVPQQELCEMYAAKDGFMRGTIFPELDIPYEPRRAAHGEGGERIE